MPFTPSHAVVALPFIRTPLVPAAVAVGAMAPDLPLFVRGTPIAYAWTHDLRWIPLTLVLALGLLLAWRMLLRPAARELSPTWLARRLPPEWDQGPGATWRETFPSAGGIVLLVVSLALGVATHIVWDLFTHEGRGGVEAIPALDAMWGPLAGYKWLQHGSSVVGLAILAVWGVLRLRRAPVQSGVRRVLPTWVRWAWWLSLPVVLAVAVVIGVLALGPIRPAFTWQHLAYAVLPPACGIWAAASGALCLLVLVLRRERR